MVEVDGCMNSDHLLKVQLTEISISSTSDQIIKPIYETPMEFRGPFHQFCTPAILLESFQICNTPHIVQIAQLVETATQVVLHQEEVEFIGFTQLWNLENKQLTLSLLRVINVKIPLQPHKKYDITQYGELD